MICKLCQDFFLADDNLVALFSFPDICPTCLDQYHPQLEFEVIPIHLGSLVYAYLYEWLDLKKKENIYITNQLSIFYEIIHQHSFDLFVFLDDDVYDHHHLIKVLFNDYRRIFIFSLHAYDLTYLLSSF